MTPTRTHLAGQLEDRRQPTTTLEGWRRFVDADEAAFELLPDAGTDGLHPADRIGYDEARIAYHAELIVVTTSTIRQILHQGRLLCLLNQREIGARRGLIVAGPAATGKTTAVKQLGRTHELRIRQHYPDADRIPVVYVTAPPKGSPRKLAMEFARFLGLPPVRSRHNVTDITEAVCQVLIDARTDLVIVDEIHNLNLATSAGEDLSDHLKYFTEHLPATFVYAGIDVERAGLFTGTRGRQIAGRAGLVRTGPFPYQQEWKGLVATMEQTLRLHHHQPGTLVGLDRYLHQRTGGMIGSLSHLIRAGSISAILDGSEQLTRELLDAIKVDHAAESAHSPGQQPPLMPLVPQAAWHIRPLPRTLRPVHHETIDSYVARLAAANAVPTATLLAYVDATPSRRNQALLQRLATVSRQPPASLSHALVEFQYLGTGTPPWRNTFPRVWNDHGMAFPACQPCMAARGITTKVEVFVPFYRRICVQHSRWLDQRQLDLRNTPEIVRAQQRHRWITRRHGRQHAGDGFGDAVHIVERWLRRGNPQALHHRCWQPRLARLGETLQALEVHVPVLHAVTYPEIVALTGMLASPFWTAMANSDHAVNRDRFYRETARRLGVPSVDPTDSLDPLFRWTYDLRYGQIGR